MRRRLLVSATALLIVCGVPFVVAGGTQAATVPGVENGKYGADQSFAVQRSPAWPTCSNSTTFNAFTVTKNSGNASPYSEATGGPVNMGSNYLMIVPSGDATAPWGIAMFNSSDQEVKWNGSSWVTSADGTYATAKRFTDKGKIYGADAEGFLHDSSPRQYGTFFSPNSVFGASRTYTPTASFNDCVSGQALAKNLENLTVESAPVTTSTTSTTTSTSSTTTTVAPAAPPVETTVSPSMAPTTVGPSTPIDARGKTTSAVVRFTPLPSSLRRERYEYSLDGVTWRVINRPTTGDGPVMFTIDNLEAGTTYEVAIRAVVAQGAPESVGVAGFATRNRLPATGADTGAVGRIALWLLAAGATVLAARRRLVRG